MKVRYTQVITALVDFMNMDPLLPRFQQLNIMTNIRQLQGIIRCLQTIACDHEQQYIQGRQIALTARNIDYLPASAPAYFCQPIPQPEIQRRSLLIISDSTLSLKSKQGTWQDWKLHTHNFDYAGQ